MEGDSKSCVLLLQVVRDHTASNTSWYSCFRCDHFLVFSPLPFVSLELSRAINQPIAGARMQTATNTIKRENLEWSTSRNGARVSNQMYDLPCRGCATDCRYACYVSGASAGLVTNDLSTCASVVRMILPMTR